MPCRQRSIRRRTIHNVRHLAPAPDLHLGASVAAWFIGVFVIRRRLEWEVSQDYATGGRISTDGDSIGLPLGTVLVLLTLLHLLLNVGIAYVAARRRHGHLVATGH